jgi:purine-binding chemotaxis protein CheW
MNKATASEPYILAVIRNTTYALPSREVERMEMVEHVTPVPNAPEYVDGIVFSRGQVVPAINLRRRFGFEAADFDVSTRLLVVSHEERLVGLIVDSAREFLSIPAEAIQPPPDVVGGVDGQYLHGIATIDQRIILVLNVAGLLRGTAN